jgi:hypothetical protein
MSNKSKISAAEKEICFGFIQSHLSAESSKSTRSSDSDSEPAVIDEFSCKDKGTLLRVYLSIINLTNPPIIHPLPKRFSMLFFSFFISSCTSLFLFPNFPDKIKELINNHDTDDSAIVKKELSTNSDTGSVHTPEHGLSNAVDAIEWEPLVIFI